MRIEDIRLEGSRLSATLLWEDGDKPPQEIRYVVEKDAGLALSCNPDGFLVTAVIPAMRHGERRVWVDGPISPELVGSLRTALAWVKHWYRYRNPIPEISAKSYESVRPSGQRGAASFLSGGVDSLAMLRQNRLRFSPDHPYYIRYAIMALGVDVRTEQMLAPAIKAVQAVAQDAGVKLVGVRTNVQELDPGEEIWISQYHGAAFSSIAHAFAGAIHTVFLAASFDIPYIEPWGSHPALDPLYGSAGLAVKHEGVALSRFEKTRLVADWQVGLDNVRVCLNPRRTTLNCCRCEKCVRTMLALLALGKLKDCQAFPAPEITPQLVATTVTMAHDWHASCYQDLLGPLRGVGREDLARAVQRQLRKYYWRRRYDAVKERVKELDQLRLGGALLGLKRRTGVKL